ncbi:MAG: 50S ribosomal protein L10 [Deltaproteobacteria bacterium]|nr:50S ribosomal protein L10 [Deltaproteobacteria bacterium]
MKKELKFQIVEEVREQLRDALAVVVVDFKGSTVAQMQGLRGELRKEGARIRVVKNTLLRKAVAGTEFEALEKVTGGQIAIAWSVTDPAIPAKVLLKFAKDCPTVVVKGGALGGRLLSAAGVDQLSKLPSKDEMRARLLAVMTAPASQFLAVLSAAPRDFLGVLKARGDSLKDAA